MLKISSPKSGDSPVCTPNLLPCRIHHNGPVDASRRYWAPEASAGMQLFKLLGNNELSLEELIALDGKLEAYFRGRKLQGREVKITEGYKGLVVKEIEEIRERDKSIDKLQEEEENAELNGDDELKDLQAVGTFNEILLWDHEQTVPDDDAFVKGVGEWIHFAEAVCSR